MAVLRDKGYDGASLNELANSSGLKKASLYHRFPGGKKDIGLAVLNFLYEWKEENITKLIANKEISAQEKLEIVVKHIDTIYLSGESSCVLRALSIGGGIDLFENELKLATQSWLDDFSALALCFGFSKEDASNIALRVLVKIQGSLLISKTLGSTTPFLNAMENIKYLYQKE